MWVLQEDKEPLDHRTNSNGKVIGISGGCSGLCNLVSGEDFRVEDVVLGLGGVL